MPKGIALPSLNVSAARTDTGQAPLSPALLSPQSTSTPKSPRSLPQSPLPSTMENHHHQHHHLVMHSEMHSTLADHDAHHGVRRTHAPPSHRMTAMPAFPASPERDAAKHAREPSKSFFSNLIASKSSHKLHSPEPSIAESAEWTNGRSRASSKDRSHSLKKQGSTPDLPRMTTTNSKDFVNGTEESPSANGSLLSPPAQESVPMAQKKSKSKLGGILNRNRPSKTDEEKPARSPPPPGLDLHSPTFPNGGQDKFATALKTAPLKPEYRERAFGGENGSTARTRSADRHGQDEFTYKKPNTAPSVAVSNSSREGGMFSSLGQSSRGMGDRLGKAGKFFGKITRSGSSHEREIPTDENYVCTTINLPLVQQTRKTRIAKKLELSKDKTEFWMPALPWRCIDYLNMNGCEEEGLYRIPGSGREVKFWQRRFDTEYDINLFDEPELYDINTIGSMFKSWLRELPDEILPKATQHKIAQECAGATSTPQLLKDELSKLPPFNYYLLFAITCHLSLLHSYADKNKMDYRNLCICFQPCLKIDAFCFQFLVLNWKECWSKGCQTEKEYLEEEYRWEKEGSTISAVDTSADERAISSSGSSGPGFSAHQQFSQTADASVQRKGSVPQINNKPRSASQGVVQPGRVQGHVNSSSVPTAPKQLKTPDQKSVPDGQLPELEGLSPIRM